MSERRQQNPGTHDLSVPTKGTRPLSTSLKLSRVKPCLKSQHKHKGKKERTLKTPTHGHNTHGTHSRRNRLPVPQSYTHVPTAIAEKKKKKSCSSLIIYYSPFALYQRDAGWFSTAKQCAKKGISSGETMWSWTAGTEVTHLAARLSAWRSAHVDPFFWQCCGGSGRLPVALPRQAGATAVPPLFLAPVGIKYYRLAVRTLEPMLCPCLRT